MDSRSFIAPAVADRFDWQEICRRYPDEFVLLTEIECDDTGVITSALVVGHGRTRSEAGNRVTKWETGQMIPFFFTGKNPPPIRFPRIVMTDEIRELLREPKQLVLVDKTRR